MEDPMYFLPREDDEREAVSEEAKEADHEDEYSLHQPAEPVLVRQEPHLPLLLFPSSHERPQLVEWIAVAIRKVEVVLPRVLRLLSGWLLKQHPFFFLFSICRWRRASCLPLDQCSKQEKKTDVPPFSQK